MDILYPIRFNRSDITVRYHIMFSDTLILPNGEKVKISEVHFEKPTHEYDIGTRMDYGRPQKDTEPDRFLEDFMKGNFVKIMEIGPSTYKAPPVEHELTN